MMNIPSATSNIRNLQAFFGRVDIGMKQIAGLVSPHPMLEV